MMKILFQTLFEKKNFKNVVLIFNLIYMYTLEVIEKYNNYSTKYLEYTTDFLNIFYLDNKKNYFLYTMYNIRSDRANFDELVLQ